MIHIDDGSRFAVKIREIPRDRGVVHLKVAAHVHTAVSAHVVLEAAVGNNNATQHGGCRVIVGPLIIDTSEVFIALKGHTASDGDLLGRSEVPQDALGGSGVQSPEALSLRGVTLLVPAGDFLTVPPETPTGVELDRSITDDVDDHGSVLGYSIEAEVNATVGLDVNGVGKIRRIEVKDL